ncbi:MAG: hypothetical protein WD768_13235 [Phycisphaeraceae bacterium]
MQELFQIPRDRLSWWGYWRLCRLWASEQCKDDVWAFAVVSITAMLVVGGVMHEFQGSFLAFCASIPAMYLFEIVRAPFVIHDKLRDERNRLEVLQVSRLDELKGLKAHIDEMAGNLNGNDNSVWVNAGQDLIEARSQGLFSEASYAGLRSILNAAEKGLHIWQRQRPLLWGVFNTFISWNQKRDPVGEAIANDDLEGLLRYGLDKFSEAMKSRIAELEDLVHTRHPT